MKPADKGIARRYVLRELRSIRAEWVDSLDGDSVARTHEAKRLLTVAIEAVRRDAEIGARLVTESPCVVTGKRADSAKRPAGNGMAAVEPQSRTTGQPDALNDE